MATPLSDVDLLARLVGFDSVSRNSNVPIADFIAEYLDRPGVTVHRSPGPTDGKVTLVIALGPEPDGSRAGLVLSGHMDVVPADEQEWEGDPFTLRTRDGRYVARGAADMKGFLALAMNRAARLDPTRLARPLVLLFTCDEELGTLGAERFVATWTEPETLPRDALIGEPTSLSVVRAHKGYLKLRLTFRGVAAHSGYPHLGHNAIEPAAKAVVALGHLRAALEAERPPRHELFPDVPFAALTVGVMHGGAAINVVPDRCVVELGIRLLPDMSADEMVARVEATVRAAVAGANWDMKILGNSPPMFSPGDAPLYRWLCDAVNQRDARSVGFATDAGWFQSMGMRCVIFGPGAIEVAHKPNEFLPADEFQRAGPILDRVVHAWCLEPG